MGGFVDNSRAGLRADASIGLGSHVSVGAEAYAAYDLVYGKSWDYGAMAKLKVHW